MDVFTNLATGFGAAGTLQNLWFALVGCVLGTLIGVLPGIGPIPTIAILLPVTYGLDPLSSLVMLAGIYYGAAVWRLDHLDPGQHAGRGVLDRHLHRRPPDGEARPRRRRARGGGARLVLRRLRRHGVHLRVRAAARRARPAIQLAGLFLADGARPHHRGGAGARLGDQGDRDDRGRAAASASSAPTSTAAPRAIRSASRSCGTASTSCPW